VLRTENWGLRTEDGNERKIRSWEVEKLRSWEVEKKTGISSFNFFNLINSINQSTRETL